MTAIHLYDYPPLISQVVQRSYRSQRWRERSGEQEGPKRERKKVKNSKNTFFHLSPYCCCRKYIFHFSEAPISVEDSPDKWIICLDICICITIILSESGTFFFPQPSNSFHIPSQNSFGLFSICFWYDSAKSRLFHYGKLYCGLCKTKQKIPHKPCELI